MRLPLGLALGRVLRGRAARRLAHLEEIERRLASLEVAARENADLAVPLSEYLGRLEVDVVRVLGAEAAQQPED